MAYIIIILITLYFIPNLHRLSIYILIHTSSLEDRWRQMLLSAFEKQGNWSWEMLSEGKETEAGQCYLKCVWKLLSRVWLCFPMDCSLLGSSVHGILPFSRGFFQPRGQTQVSCIAGEFFTIWATREAPKVHMTVPCSDPPHLGFPSY